MKLVDRYLDVLNVKTEAIEALQIEGKNYQFFAENAPVRDVFSHEELVRYNKEIQNEAKKRKLSEDERTRMWNELSQREIVKKRKLKGGI